MKKRFVTIFLYFIMIVSVVSSVSATESPQIIVSDAVGCSGDTVDITVSLENNPGIVSMTLTVDFDENVLTLIEVSDTSLMPGQMHTTKKASPYILTWENDTSKTDYYANGTVVTLSFQISETAKVGEYSIKLDHPLDGIYNYDIENIDFILKNGAVQVVEKTSSEKSTSQVQHIHEFVHVAGREASCVREGQLEYWYCSSCNKKYIDQAGTISVGTTELVIDPTNHIGRTMKINERTPTASADGYSGDVYCGECGQKITMGHTIPAYGGNNVDHLPYDSVCNGNVDAWKNPFADITEADSYYEAIRFVYENGLFKGISDTEFAPWMTMTRAMFVTVLGRLEKVDIAYFVGSGYKDVTLGEWYAPYVEWASENGIVNGYGDGRFGVNDQITVEQATVILARYAEYIGIDTYSELTFERYQDYEKISVWAIEQMKWAVENEIYRCDDYSLAPQQPAKRSLVAEMLYSFADRALLEQK